MTKNLGAALLHVTFVTVVVMCTVVVAAQAPLTTPTLTDPPRKDGWWIRVNPDNQASNLYFRFGSARNRLAAPVAWIQGQSPVEGVDVPTDARGLDQLHIAAMGISPRAPVSFCLFFRDRGIALVRFTQETTLMATRDQFAAECTP